MCKKWTYIQLETGSGKISTWHSKRRGCPSLLDPTGCFTNVTIGGSEVTGGVESFM